MNQFPSGERLSRQPRWSVQPLCLVWEKWCFEPPLYALPSSQMAWFVYASWRLAHGPDILLDGGVLRSVWRSGQRQMPLVLRCQSSVFFIFFIFPSANECFIASQPDISMMGRGWVTGYFGLGDMLWRADGIDTRQGGRFSEHCWLAT